MRNSRIAGFALTGAVLSTAACAANPSPVPVQGPAEDISALAGQWRGEYWSVESGRSGTIWFELEAGRDTAFGDILMIPAGQVHAHADDRHPPSEFLTIRFVGILEGRIRGMLDTYRDPLCGCRLETTFEGRLHADTISGTYQSRHLEGGDLQHGHWRAIRHLDRESHR